MPLFTALETVSNSFNAFLLVLAALVAVTGYTSINAVVKAELFPTKIRATGVGLPYALTVSIFGGSAPAVALAFKNAGHETWFYFYLTGAIFIFAGLGSKVTLVCRAPNILRGFDDDVRQHLRDQMGHRIQRCAARPRAMISNGSAVERCVFRR